MMKKRSMKSMGSKSAKMSGTCCEADPCNSGCYTSLLHPMHLGLTLGLLWGSALFAMTAMGLETGASTFIGLIFKGYIGMPTAMAGGVFSLAYGFMDGFFGGLIIGSLYNLFNRKCTMC